MVPEDMTLDAAESRKIRTLRQQQQQAQQAGGGGNRPSPATMRRHTVTGAVRPQTLPVQMGNTEPIPVPSQKANYQQIQASLIRSRSKSGDSVSAMSGVSSASGGSTLGPLPEERSLQEASPAVVRRSRASSLSSPASSPKSPCGKGKTRRIAAAPIPDICQLTPPPLQYTMGTPPLGHRRRTSSSSSCGTPPPNMQWQISPSRLGAPSLTSPVRTRPISANPLHPNVPCLSPILGSPNKGSQEAAAAAAASGTSTAVMQWTDNGNNPSLSASGRALTMPENLAGVAGADAAFKRRSAELQFAGGRNVVLNYPGGGLPPSTAPVGGAGAAEPFERSSSLTCLTRRHSSGGKENNAPLSFPDLMPELMPPPALSEETLLAPEHNEILAKIKFIGSLVDTIIEVARCKAAPLTVITETMGPKVPTSADPGSSSAEDDGGWDSNSPLHRRLQQLLLYMRCLHLLSQTMEFARTELKSKRLKPSTSVKNGKI